MTVTPQIKLRAIRNKRGEYSFVMKINGCHPKIDLGAGYIQFCDAHVVTEGAEEYGVPLQVRLSIFAVSPVVYNRLTYNGIKAMKKAERQIGKHIPIGNGEDTTDRIL